MKNRKNLGKPCPECEEKTLHVVSKTEVNDDGVEFTTKVIECLSCGYIERFHNSKKNNREQLIFRGKEVAPKKKSFK